MPESEQAGRRDWEAKDIEYKDEDDEWLELGVKLRIARYSGVIEHHTNWIHTVWIDLRFTKEYGKVLPFLFLSTLSWKDKTS